MEWITNMMEFYSLQNGHSKTSSIPQNFVINRCHEQTGYAEEGKSGSIIHEAYNMLGWNEKVHRNTFIFLTHMPHPPQPPWKCGQCHSFYGKLHWYSTLTCSEVRGIGIGYLHHCHGRHPRVCRRGLTTLATTVSEGAHIITVDMYWPPTKQYSLSSAPARQKEQWNWNPECSS